MRKQSLQSNFGRNGQTILKELSHAFKGNQKVGGTHRRTATELERGQSGGADLQH